MALLALEGIYKDGKFEFKEKPEGVKRSHVVITFLAPEAMTDTERREMLRHAFFLDYSAV